MSVEILIGDVFEKIATLQDDSVDCCVSSFPYWGLRDYGVDGQIGLEPTLGEHIEVVVAVCEEIKRVLKPEGTFWLNYGDCYATSPNGRSAADTKASGNDDRTFRDKPFSTVGPIGGKRSPAGANRKDVDVGGWGASDDSLRWRGGGLLKPKDLLMMPNRIAIALQDVGWWVRSEIIWHKPNPMPESVTDRPACAHEKIFLLTKSARYWYDADAVRTPCADRSAGKMPDGWDTGPGAHGSIHRAGREKGRKNDKQRGHGRRHAGFNKRWDQITREEQQATGANLRNVWTVSTSSYRDAHFATFPTALIEPCIKAGCPAGGLVLDPFGGAGTTGLVADRLERNAILIELNPEYAELARRRIEDDAGMFATVV